MAYSTHACTRGYLVYSTVVVAHVVHVHSSDGDGDGDGQKRI